MSYRRVEIAFIILFASGMIAVYALNRSSNAKLHDAQLAACERGNIVRVEINKRGVVLANFLDSAATVREQTATVQRKQGSNAEAKLNEDVAARWHSDAKSVNSIEIPNCDEVVP